MAGIRLEVRLPSLRKREKPPGTPRSRFRIRVEIPEVVAVPIRDVRELDQLAFRKFLAGEALIETDRLLAEAREVLAGFETAMSAGLTEALRLARSVDHLLEQLHRRRNDMTRPDDQELHLP